MNSSVEYRILLEFQSWAQQVLFSTRTRMFDWHAIIQKINKTFCYSTQLLLTWINVFVFSTLQTTLGGFKPSILGFWVECSTTLLSGHNQSVQKTRETFKTFLNAFSTYKLIVSFLVAHKSWEYRLALLCLVQRGMNIVFLPM